MKLSQSHINFPLVLFSLLIFLCITFPLPVFFSNDEFGSLPLIAQGKLIFSSLPRPLANASLYTDFLMWKFDPFGYHLTNILIHLVNAVAIWFFYCELQKETETNGAIAKRKSFAASILFLFYSNCSECVFWVSARASSLATFFILISLFFFLKKNSKINLFISLLSFVAALLTYETSWMTIPFIIVLYFFKRQTHPDQRLLPILAIYAFVFLSYLFWRHQIMGEFVSGYGNTKSFSGESLRIAKNFSQLVTRTILQPMQSTKDFIIGSIFLLLAGAAVLFKKIKSIKTWPLKNTLICLLLLFCLSIAPVLSIGISIHSTEGERFIYLTNVFLIMILTEGAILVTNKKIRLFLILVFTIVIVQAFFLIQKARYYRASSQMVLSVVQQLKRRAPAKFENIYVIDQPDNLNGAVMFRKGFAYAIKWLIPDLEFERTITFNYVKLTAPYEINFKNTTFESIKDQLPHYAIEFERNRDCIIWFRSDTTYFVR